MKKGLTYIGERTGQLRYADDAEKEQWVQQTSTYIPLVEIKRGQPVSIATIDDLKIVAGDNTDLFEALKNSSDTYVVLTNPSRHVSTVGLALEYTEGAVALENGKLKTAEKIHIIGQGLYVEDRDYVAQAFTEADAVDVSAYEYWPEFFDDYENSIGKKIYVKGGVDGQLTLVKEEAYLAYNQVIVVGFVSDANIKNGTNTMNVGAIEVQMMGDDRGAVDATMFEAVIGEDVYIGRNKIQVNGETNSGTKVFALGCEDDEIFKFSFNFLENQNELLPRGFIAIQRIDGATAYVCVNGLFTEEEVLNNEGWTAKDRAFVQVAQYYAATSGNTNSFLGIKDYDNKAKVVAPVSLDTFMSDAFAAVSRGEVTSLKDGTKHNPSKLIQSSTQTGVYHFMADDIGGSYEVYISSNLENYVTALYIASRGSNYNKGYAVLADIRNRNRQNIIGVYNSGHTGLITQGTRAIFLKQGLFTDSTKPYEVGATYYLGSHGNIFLVPQEFYNSIVQIGYAQTEENLIVDCCDSRQYNNGDLPVGYMKPTIRGEAEFGFWAMDGKTPHKTSDSPGLLTRLKEFYDEGELAIKSYNFGTKDEPDYAEGYIIPEVNYKSHFNTDNTTGYVAAQIKWLASAVYKEMPRTPFVRRTATIQKFVKDGKTYERAVLPDIDITSLMIYGPDENRMQVPDLETLDIKLFVDLDKTSTSRNWTQIEPGFHTTNNFTYYGFKWTVVQTKAVDSSHPYGEYALRAVYSGTENELTEDVDTSVLGICFQADPFAPPVSLAGFEAKIFVTKHDYYSRQFDVESLFKDYVKESVVDVSGNPWQNNAVSGQAVRNDIKYRVDTDDLDISDEDNVAGTVDAYVKHIYLTSAKETPETEQDRNKYFNDRLIKSDVRFANPNGTDIWNIDYYNGLFQFFTSDATVTRDISLESKIRQNDYALMPFFMFKKHEDAMIADEALLEAVGADDKVEYPHGIKNDGYRGTINARQLQGAYLGYGEYIFSQNAGDTINNEDSGDRVENVTITIPYTQKYGTSDPKYITRLGNVIKQYHGTNLLDTNELSYNAASNVLTRKHNNTMSLLAYEENFFGLKTKYTPSDNLVEFLVGDSGSDYAEIKALAFTPSSIKYKYLLHSFANKNADTTFISNFTAKDKRETYTETMNEALQAIYEMPLATFQYNRQYESGDEHFKRFFGIVVEQMANTSKKFGETSNIDNKTTVDDLSYVYSDAEAKSISEYLKLVTDDGESGMNTNNVVGMLLKAAKETQERLLNLEVAAYGKDSPTLPGADTENSNYSIDQKSTVAGLNRLVKALCREVFQDADPSNINEKGAWSENSDNYSRLDMLDKEVNGDAAKEENKTRIPLADVTTYPNDASVTQGVTYAHQKIADADKNNDFSDAQDFLKEATYTSVSSASDKFDGLNDAVNRIVAKLNQLTTDVKGTDEIKNRPLKLDYIRQTLETILREVYDDSNVTATTLEGGSYKKANVSRIDRIIEELYNFDLNATGKNGGIVGKFNNKDLKGTKTGIAADTTTFTGFESESPENLAELKDKASIVDVIIQLLTGDERTLVRTDAVAWSDREVTNEGYKAKAVGDPANAAVGVTYNPVNESFDNNETYFNKDTVIERLNTIEKALQLISLKVQNKLDFTKLKANEASAGAEPYDKVTSIDDYFNHIADLFGITFEKDGFYRTERDATINAEAIKTIGDGNTANKQTTLDLYNIIYDIVTRIENNEAALHYNDVVLGSDYDDYVDSNKNKSTYESLDGHTAYTKDYTVTSDLKAIQKLLYGKDEEVENRNANSNHTIYGHHNTAAALGDDFTKSPLSGGVSILDELYKMLYKVPTVRSQDAQTVQTVPYDEMSGYSALRYDPASPRTTTPSTDSNPTLIGRGRRSKFIAQSVDDAPLNRIDILENETKAIYKYLGLGSNENVNYYSGTFTIAAGNAIPSQLWGSSETETDVTNNGHKQLINGTDYDVNDRFHEIDLKGNASNYAVSAIALQAYYNTLDLADLFSEYDTTGKRVATTYVKAARTAISADTTHQKVKSTTSTSVSSYLSSTNTYRIFEAVKNALSYADKLDEGLMKLEKAFLEEQDTIHYTTDNLWTVLGTDYEKDTKPEYTVTERLDKLEKEVFIDGDDKEQNLRERMDAAESGIKTLEGKVGSWKTGSTNNATACTRIETLEEKQAAVIAAINNVDNDTATVNGNYDIADNVFKTVKSSDVADVSTDDTVESNKNVLATKASVESLVAKAMTELQTEMKTAIQNNRKLAALMAYMKCDDIKASADAVKFVRSGESWDEGYDMQEKELTFKAGSSATGSITINGSSVKYCGEQMINITLEDKVDHLKYTCYVPYNPSISGTDFYSNQTFGYGSGNNSSSLDDDSYIITID